MDQFLQIGVCMLEILHSKVLVTGIYIPIKYHACFQWRTAEQEITIADLFSTATIQLQCLQNYSSTAGKTNQQIPVLRGSLFLFYLEQFHSHLWTIFTINEEQGMLPVLGQISAICYEKFSTALPHNLWYWSVCIFVPVGTPGYGGSHADIWKQNTVVLNPVQGIMHFTEG